MSTISKLIGKMEKIPNNFPVSDLDRVLTYFQYYKSTSSGSGIKYTCSETGSVISFHRPHGGEQTIKPSTIRDVVAELRASGRLPYMSQ